MRKHVDPDHNPNTLHFNLKAGLMRRREFLGAKSAHKQASQIACRGGKEWTGAYITEDAGTRRETGWRVSEREGGESGGGRRERENEKEGREREQERESGMGRKKLDVGARS